MRGNRRALLLGGRAAFSPKDNPKNLFWLDSQDNAFIATSGGFLTTWTDKIGGAVLTPQVANTNVVGVQAGLGGRQCISIPSGNYLTLATAPAALALNLTVDTLNMFACGLNTGTTGYAPALLNCEDINLGITGPSNTGSPSPGFPGVAFGGGFLYWATAPSVSGIASVLSYQLNNAISQLYVDGAAATSTAFAPSSATLVASNGVKVGVRAGSEFWSGYAGDMIIGKNLTTFERQQNEGYIAWKSGGASRLPIGHPFKNSPP